MDDRRLPVGPSPSVGPSCVGGQAGRRRLRRRESPIRAGDASFARQLGEHRRRRNDEQWSLQVRAGAGADEVSDGERLLASATAPNGDIVAVVVREVAVSDA